MVREIKKKKKEKIYKIIIFIAIMLDLIIFGSLIYSNRNLKKELNTLSNEFLKLENRLENQGSQLYEVDTKISNTIAEKEKAEKQQEYENNPNNIAVKNLDKNIFLTDFENYKPENNDVKISESKAKEMAQKGFEESKKRIAGEGADDKDSETVKIEQINANNYFTRLSDQSDKIYKEISRKCYIIQRENDMGNGISIYVDATTGLIIGGEAFGD